MTRLAGFSLFLLLLCLDLGISPAFAAAPPPESPRLRLTWTEETGGGERDVSPLCISQLIMGKTILPSVAVRGGCENADGSLEYKTYVEKDWLMTSYKLPSASGEAAAGVVGYRVVGDVPEGKVVETVYRPGTGPSRQTAGVIVRIDGDNLVPVKVLGGGDRCNHGFARSSIEDGVLTYGFYMTALDLVRLVFGSNREMVDPGHLESGPTSCFAIASYQAGELDSIEMIPAAFEKDRDGWTERFYKQSCMNELLRDATKKRSVLLPAQLTTAMQLFMRVCKDEHIKMRQDKERQDKIRAAGG